jgi:hypothetical protein
MSTSIHGPSGCDEDGMEEEGGDGGVVFEIIVDLTTVVGINNTESCRCQDV